MSLVAGNRVGPYEILALIGAGGMGEVYRAHDPRLHRDVAIKISHKTFSDRFEREAHAIAALNHPHICQIYDVGPDYLVMEFVEGAPLAAVEGSRQLLDLAVQIADGLAAAHAAGFVHRDLKPDNILVTRDNRVKILDFGLAKQTGGAPTSEATRTVTTTNPGTVLGTVAYMSPEQARGRELDARSDQFSFGLILYEMAAGKRAFARETSAETMAAIIRDEPEPLPASVPAPLRWTIERCLSKDPAERYDSTRDLYRELRQIRQRLSEAASALAVASPAPPSKSGRLLGPTAAALALAAATGIAAWFGKPKPDEPLLQTEITAPAGAKLGPPRFGQLALSPDGRRLVFLATKDGTRSLWLRQLSSGISTPLPGTAGATEPFWSPDSRWVGFIAGSQLQKIDVEGGRLQVICDVNGYSDIQPSTWNSDGVILFSTATSPIQRVSASGGSPTAVYSLDTAAGETSQRAPFFLPDGRHFLFHPYPNGYTYTVGSLDGKPRKPLFANVHSPPTYAPGAAGKGWLLYIANSQLMARPFDAAKAEVTGEPAVVSDSLPTGPSWSASANGILAFRHAAAQRLQLTWFNRDGKPVGVAGDVGDVGDPRISPDQKTIAFHRYEGSQSDIRLFDMVRGSETRFSSGPGFSRYPLWLAGDESVLYTVYKDKNSLVRRPMGGAGRETIVAIENGEIVPTGVSPDGRWVVLVEENFDGGGRLVLRSLVDGKRIPAVESKAADDGSISPDGHWLLYSELLSERREIFMQSMPAEAGGAAGAEGKFTISTAGGSQPRWRRDGKEIFYLSENGKMMAVPVESGPGVFRPGAPKTLFAAQTTDGYDVSSDGQRFLIPQSVEDSAEVPITIIYNWPKLLQK